MKDSGALRRSEKEMLGRVALPRARMAGSCAEMCRRSRWKEAVTASSWPSRRDCFTEAKREGSAVLSVAEREAKTEEMSPSFLGGVPAAVVVT